MSAAAKRASVLSFDIGIRHLAYCILERVRQETETETETVEPDGGTTHYHVLAWKVVDLFSVTGTVYEESCVYHVMKSWNVAQLKAWLHSRSLADTGRRAELLARIEADLKARKIAKFASNDIGVLAVQMFHYFDQHPELVLPEWVVIENQPALKNPTMKSVQMLVYSYFVYKGMTQQRPAQHVQFVSAQNKTKVYDGPPITLPKKEGGPSLKKYKKTKLLAIAHTRYFLTQWGENATLPWRIVLEGSNKKDDLSDALLQALYAFSGVVDRRNSLRGKGAGKKQSSHRKGKRIATPSSGGTASDADATLTLCTSDC